MRVPNFSRSLPKFVVDHLFDYSLPGGYEEIPRGFDALVFDDMELYFMCLADWISSL